MGVTPHTMIASKTCIQKTLETTISSHYFAFRDRN
jgi:hypothetical protein